MSEGAIASAPAAACESAVFASSSIERSLSTSPSSRTQPQWPWEVYSHMQVSAITVSSGSASLSARIAICTMPSSSKAPEPISSLSAGMPKSSTESTPAARTAPASSTSSLIDSRCTPGIESMSSRTSVPALTNNGWIRCAAVSSVSRVSPRSTPVRRSRRIRVAGKAMATEFRYLRA